MLPLLLAVATSLAEPLPPPPFAESCDPIRLQALLTTPVKQVPAAESDLDVKISATLAEERRQQGALVADDDRLSSMEADARHLRWLGLVLLAVGLALCVAAARRRSVALAFAAIAVLLVQAGGNWYAGTRLTGISFRRAGGASRVLALTACRLRLTEARGLLQQSQLSHCIHDLDEADEDLTGWLSRIRNGTVIGAPDIEKLHHEIQSSLRR